VNCSNKNSDVINDILQSAPLVMKRAPLQMIKANTTFSAPTMVLIFVLQIVMRERSGASQKGKTAGEASA
jgi:hypothetical protein